MNCPHCGNVLQDDAVFCDQCGARVSGVPAETATAAPAASASQATPMSLTNPASGAVLCPGCGAENLPGEMFCAECGTPLEAPTPEPVAPQETVTPAEALAPIEPATAAPSPAEDAAPSAETDSAEAATPAQEPGLTCAACGAQVRPGDAFCFACGARLADQHAPAATPAPAPETVVVAPTPAPVEAATPAYECPSCGAKVQPGDLFCDFCGAALTGGASASAAASAAADAAAPVAPQATAAPLGGEQPYLVVSASGVELPLPQGAEALVGREDPYSNVFPDVDLAPHGGEEAGVSRRHFKLTLAEGHYAIQDLGSTNYTWVNQQRLEPNTPVQISDGDEIRAGRLKLVFRTRS